MNAKTVGDETESVLISVLEPAPNYRDPTPTCSIPSQVIPIKIYSTGLIYSCLMLVSTEDVLIE